AADGRAALHDRQPVGCEDERRELTPKRLGRGKPRAVELRRLRGTRCELDPYAVPDTGPRELQLHRRRLVALADHARVAARPGREALRAEMDRLEQARLAGAVLAGHEDDTRRECELE